jgi:hypothetical protein
MFDNSQDLSLQKLPVGRDQGLDEQKHKQHWQSTHGQGQAKGFLKKIPVKEPGELLSLRRNQLKMKTGFLTGHCHLKEHLFNWDL